MDRREWKYLGGIWLAVLAIYLPILFSGRTLADNPALIDLTTNFMPNLTWMARSWKAGLFPLWNPHTEFGMPQLAYTHCGGLYPVNVPLILLPYVWAISGLIVFHALAAGTLCYLVLRGHEVEPPAAIAGAITFIFTGSYLGTMVMPWSMGSSSGFLLAWLCVRRLAVGPSFPRLAGAALGLAWTGIAGDVELFIYALPLLGLVSLAAGPYSRNGLIRSALLFGLATAVAIMILVAMALPANEMVHHSIRGPAMPFKITIITMGSNWPIFLPTIFFPFSYYRDLSGSNIFNQGLPPGYQNFLAIWLFGLGVIYAFARRSERVIYCLAAGLAAFYVLRALPQTSWLFDPLPLIGSLHFFAPKIGLFFQLLVLIAGGRVLTAARSEPALDRSVSYLLVLAGAAMVAAQPFCLGGPERYLIGAAAVAGGLVALRSSRPGWRVTDGAAAHMAAALIAIEVLALAWRQVPRTDPKAYDLPTALNATAASLAPESRYLIFETVVNEKPNVPSPLFGLFDLASGANNISGPARVLPARSFLFICLFVPDIIYRAANGDRVLDLWNITNPSDFDRGRMHLFNLAGPSLVLSRDRPVPYSTPYKLFLPGAAGWRTKNIEARSGTVTARAPASLSTELSALPGDRLQLSARADRRAWLVALAGTPERRNLILARSADPGRPLDLSASAAPLGSGADFRLGLLPDAPGPATVVLSALNIYGPARFLRLRETRGDTMIFDNRDADPRAFIVHRSESIPSIPGLMERLSDPARFHPLTEALLETDQLPGPLLPPAGKGSEKVLISKYGPQRVEMSAGLSAPGLLILTDSWFPGWRARVQTDGGNEWEARVLPADLAFRAIYLPRGRHFVSFTYEPLSFRIGLFVSIASLLSLLAAATFRRARRRSRA